MRRRRNEKEKKGEAGEMRRRRNVYTIQPCTMSHHFMQGCTHMVHVCLAVTCHLHFWQNDQDLLCATAVTWGWNGYQNKESAQ